MFKRFWWVFLAMAGIGTFMWLALSRAEPKKNVPGAVSNQETAADRPAIRKSDLSGEELDREVARDSSRHSAGEVERHQAEERRLAPLTQTIKEQEEKVEERRKVLATIVRTKGIIYKGPDADYSAKAETPEDHVTIGSPNIDIAKESVRRGQDAQDFVDAMRELETDKRLLQEMKLKLLSEKIADESGGR